MTGVFNLIIFSEGAAAFVVFQAREAVSLAHHNDSSSFKSALLNKPRSVFLTFSLYHRSLKFRFISLFAVKGGFDLIGEAKKAVRTGFGEENSLWESFWKKVLVVTAVRIS